MEPEPDSAPIPSSVLVRSLQVNAEQPWLGLLPYKEEHHDFFFGRDREVEDILGRIRDNSLTILYGQSGLGKSSLLAAGVMPRLRQAGYAPRWARLAFSDSAEGHRYQTLVQQTQVLISAAQGTLKAEDFDGAASLQQMTFWERFHHRDSPASPIPVPVLIFDQFEEIFTLGAHSKFEDEVADWLEQMADLLQNRPPRHLAERLAQDAALADKYHFDAAAVRIVFTLREDYLAQLERWKARLPLLMQNRMALTLLTGPQARQAVLGPAKLGAYSLVSREVADSIVRIVARGRADTSLDGIDADAPVDEINADTPVDEIKAVPPLLSLLCEQLNIARLSTDSPQITLASVRHQSARILQRFYEDSFLSFPGEHRARIRSLLEDPPMITEAGHRNALVREDAEAQLRRAGVADVSEIFDTLIQRRLITAETRDQVQRLEITHDVLVPLLLRSRKERQDREAAELAQHAAAARAEKKRVALEQERLLQERRRLRFLSGVMTLLTIAAIGFAGYGWWQAQTARKAESMAVEARLSAIEASRNAERARLEAVEASHRADKAKQSALTAAEKVKAAHEKNLRTLHEASMADYATAVQQIEMDGKWEQGIAHLARSLKWEPVNPLAAGRLYSTLSLYAAANQSWPRMILRSQGFMYSAQFSADGTRIVTVSEGDTARVWDAASGKPVGEPLRHEGDVNSAQFSADGTRIVTASEDGTARVWDAASGRPLGEPLRHEGSVVRAQFSADGTRIVTASENGAARVWDASSGRPMSELTHHKDRVNSTQFSSDGRRIVTASEDKTARVWDVASGKPIGEPLHHEGGVTSAQFSADGTRIVTASGDGTARVWDAASGRPLGEPLRHEIGVNSAQFSADGTRIVTASEDETARVWDAASGRPIGEPLRHEAMVVSAQFSADGTRIVTASFDKTARVWDAASGKPLGEPLRHEGVVMSAQFSADGTRIVTASEDETAQVWDAAGGKPIGEPLRHGGDVTSAQFSADGTRIVTASEDGTTRVWDAASGKPVGEPLRHKDNVYSAQFSADGTRIVTASADNTAVVWEAVSGKLIGEPLRHKDGVTNAQFSADGTRIVTASLDKTARVWNSASGKPLGEPLRHEGGVYSAQFSADGTRIVTASEDKTARVWDAASGQPIFKLALHEDDVTSAQFSADGTRIVTASDDRTARVWDAASGRLIGEPLRHQATVRSAQFSADGTRVVTASWDRTARVWDVASGKPVGEPLRHEDVTYSAQFSADGTRIVTASLDQTARVWGAKWLLHPLPPVPEWMLQRAWAIAGLEFDADGQINTIPGEQRLAILSGPPPGDDAWAKLARWLALPAAERTLTPESNFTSRQIAERERDSGTKEGIKSALRYDPTVPLAHLLLAKFEDDPQRAAFLRDFELKHLPKDAALWSRASEILRSQEESNMALEAARRAVALNASQIAAHRALAYALAASNQPAEALQNWDKVLADKAATFDDFCEAGHLAAEMNQGDKARGIFREGETRFPEIPIILRLKGQALLLLRAPAEALAAFQAYETKLAAYDGSKPTHDPVARMAVSRWLTGDKDGAVADYQRLIGMGPAYTFVEAVTNSDWEDVIKQPLLQVQAETLKRHPELAPEKE